MLLMLPTERNKLTLAWRGPYQVVGTVGEVDYKIEISPGMVKTYHVNMLKRYFHRGNVQKDAAHNGNHGSQEGRTTDCVESENPEEINQAASVACVLEDEETDEAVAITDADTLPLYN